MKRSRAGGADALLLAEVVLVLVLFGLAVALYWIPSAEGAFAPGWWTPVLLVGLFFGVLGLETYRRRRQRHTELHRGIREQARQEGRGEAPSPPGERADPGAEPESPSRAD